MGHDCPALTIDEPDKILDNSTPSPHRAIELRDTNPYTWHSHQLYFASRVVEYSYGQRKTNEKNLAWVDGIGMSSEPFGSVTLLTASSLSPIHAISTA